MNNNRFLTLIDKNLNHFAHLVLARSTIESTVGNLLGDFCKGVDSSALPPPIKAGLDNHRAVDRFTDTYPAIVDLKKQFSSQRRRYAGIALDIYFDHLLIKHWEQLEQGCIQARINLCYANIRAGQPLMPHNEMQRVTCRIVEYDWFGSYANINNIAESLDRVANRIRFPNQFGGAIEDILKHEKDIASAFIEFFPALKNHIQTLDLENPQALKPSIKAD
ncbi:MAG: acyl carrier protein phosphodiesterase [Gammaproteobacteria bacterium]|jgi:acyl carrier protein phosphodiesterase